MNKKYFAISVMIISFILLFITIYVLYFKHNNYQTNINIATFVVDNNIYKKSEVLFGKVVDFPAAPEIEGKKFLYWSLNEKEYENEEINEDVIFYAKYENND